MENQQCVDLRKILEQFSELQGPCAGCLRPGEGALPDRSYSCAALEDFDDAQRIDLLFSVWCYTCLEEEVNENLHNLVLIHAKTKRHQQAT